MTYFDELEREPWRFDFFAMMRRIERSLGGALDNEEAVGVLHPLHRAGLPRPRIGDSASRKEEVIKARGRVLGISLGQDPWMAFPASNVCEIQWRPRQAMKAIKADTLAEFEDATIPPEPDRIHIVVRFLGLLGPQGPLPLPTTEEAHGWLLEDDSSFAHFLDLFNNRFLQLFYRTWADARPIAQHDRADCDRFKDYVNSVIGIGSPAFAGLDAVPSGISLYAGLLGAKAKSASRLCAAIRGLFGVDVEIGQLIGSWLTFDEDERSSLGSRNSTLGDGLFLGASSFSVQDKICVRLYVRDMAQYERFLPYQDGCRAVYDFMFFCIGHEIDWDLELSLPAAEVTAIRLGQSGKLGWTSWMSPNYAPDERRCDAHFNPAARARPPGQSAARRDEKVAR